MDFQKKESIDKNIENLEGFLIFLLQIFNRN